MRDSGWEYQYGKLWWGYLDGKVVASIEKSDVGRWRARAFSDAWQDRFKSRGEARSWVDQEVRRYARRAVRALCRKTVGR